MLHLTDAMDSVPEPETPQDEPQPENTEEMQHHLSLNAMKGQSGMGIIRFTGMIGNIEVQVLVDGGSSDTYLQPRIAQFLKVPIEPTPKFQVLVGNGESLTVEGIVRKLQIQVQGHELTVPAYLLPVAGADLILGSSWLATLGPHIADYANLTLKFYQQGKFITLQGDRGPAPQQSQLHQLRRMQHTNSIAQCFTVQLIQPVSSQDILEDLPSDIEP
jgi:predicted aspartyl protease